MDREELFAEVCSKDFLNFSFSGKSYQTQLNESIAKTKELAGVKVEVITVPGIANDVKIVWVTHNFGFLGGSLGCAEGEKVARAFEYAKEHKLPVCVQCRTGGARMQEGTSSLMQMAKVSVAVEALQREHLAFISVLNDPTYGGVSASYAMQADVRIAVSPSARIGFAGPQVILNTMCEADQSRFDEMCPPDFQSSSYVANYGQLDMVLEDNEDGSAKSQQQVEETVGRIAALLGGGRRGEVRAAEDPHGEGWVAPTEADMSAPFNYTKSRAITRPQTQDIAREVFDNFVELYGDGRVGRDSCIRGGIASFEGLGDHPCVVIGTYKGHTPHDMQDTNYGMASPHGYRTALRLMKMAERFGLPVVTLVDTVGAWPTFECERDGQSEAIATNLTAMAGLRVPIVTLLVGEGGSGGALGIGMGNSIGMLSGGYFGVISPEGAASILGRYSDDAHKSVQFPKDCQELAVAQCIYANQLKEIGVVDEIIWEHFNGDEEEGETYQNFPILKSRIRAFLMSTLSTLMKMSPEELVSQRYTKFRSMGMYDEILTTEERKEAVQSAEDLLQAAGGAKPRARRTKGIVSKVIQHIADETMSGSWSRYRKASSPSLPTEAPAAPDRSGEPTSSGMALVNAKSVLDSEGPAALALWVREQSQTLITDTTMRDAHQSLLATRVRTEDIVKAAHCATDVLKSAFSLECWGGATFDVAMRFLDECPWERLREIRAACPNICLQMLLRGSNAVGYTSYPDNVVAEFVRLAALNGIDVFRIFDCFNDVDSMKVSIDAVVAAGKVAEVAVCYTGNLLTSEIYHVEYYKDVAKRAVDAGAHIIGLKDMAGLLRPNEAGVLVKALREVLPASMPIHFHTHSTSSGAIATCMEMARQGCDIIDVCTASMADGTSQPSMNAFVAMMEGCPNETGINYLDLEAYDMYWARVRLMYGPFESGMLSGSARVYEHQIPGGQYSNLLVQCHSMGLWDRWEEVLDAYRDSNRVLGDIVKVTPSSKCVGDLALYLVTRNISAADLLDPSKAASIDFPESVVGLMRGDLGFPHRGFPEEVEKAVLRGAPKRSVRAGLTLPAEDLVANRENLSAKWGIQISEEQAMSSLMYPKVFSDYMTRQQQKGGEVLRHLPSPVYFYGMTPGQSFTISVPSKTVMQTDEEQQPVLLPVGTGPVGTSGEFCQVSVKLERITPLKSGCRDLIFTVNGMTQVATVKDTSGAFVFDGPMAKEGDVKQMGSPMPGVVEKLLVSAGQTVSAGDTLCTVSAMKMEVKVTAPADGEVASIHVEVGTRVVDGALLVSMK